MRAIIDRIVREATFPVAIGYCHKSKKFIAKFSGVKAHGETVAIALLNAEARYHQIHRPSRQCSTKEKTHDDQ